MARILRAVLKLCLRVHLNSHNILFKLVFPLCFSQTIKKQQPLVSVAQGWTNRDHDFVDTPTSVFAIK